MFHQRIKSIPKNKVNLTIILLTISKHFRIFDIPNYVKPKF